MEIGEPSTIRAAKTADESQLRFFEVSMLASLAAAVGPFAQLAVRATGGFSALVLLGDGRSRDGIVVFRFEDPLIGPEGCFSAEIRVGGQVLRLFDTCDMSTYFGVGPPGSAFCSESTERLRPGHSAKKSGG